MNEDEARRSRYAWAFAYFVHGYTSTSASDRLIVPRSFFYTSHQGQCENLCPSMEKMKVPKTVFGYHLVLDCYGCDHKAIGSISICYQYLDAMTAIMKVHKQSAPFVVSTDAIKYPDKAGISGWVPIVESGISIHTLTPTNFISIDVYSCKKYSLKKVRDFTRKTFSPKEIEEKFFLRGEKYVHPKKRSHLKRKSK